MAEEDNASAVKLGEPDARKHFEVFKPLQGGADTRSIADTRWATPWEMADDQKDVRARLVAKAYRGPDFKGGSVGASGCVRNRAVPRQIVFLGALEQCEI